MWCCLRMLIGLQEKITEQSRQEGGEGRREENTRRTVDVEVPAAQRRERRCLEHSRHKRVEAATMAMTSYTTSTANGTGLPGGLQAAFCRMTCHPVHASLGALCGISWSTRNPIPSIHEQACTANIFEYDKLYLGLLYMCPRHHTHLSLRMR
jgi:hypothetical protein